LWPFFFGWRRSRISQMWSDTLSTSEPFAIAIMPRDRFQSILSNLHCVNNETLPARGEEAFDAFGKVRPMIERLNDRFRKTYMLRRYCSVDEMSIGFGGKTQSGTRTSLRHKPTAHRFGFHIYSVHCSWTAYLYRFEPHHAPLSKMCAKLCPDLAAVAGNLHTVMPLYFCFVTMWSNLWRSRRRR
jgi:Transposase IS4